MKICPGNYGDFACVSLESMICPEVLNQAYERGIICDGIICDGDNKTFEKIKEVDPYGKFWLSHHVKRYECLSHRCKRQKAHLIEWQKDRIRQARKDKAQKISAGVKKMFRKNSVENYPVKIFPGEIGQKPRKNPLK